MAGPPGLSGRGGHGRANNPPPGFGHPVGDHKKEEDFNDTHFDKWNGFDGKKGGIF